MKYHIVIKNGKWTVNGKPLSECNKTEKYFMDRFFREKIFLNNLIPKTNG